MRTGDPRSRAGAGREWKGRPLSDGRFTNDVARAFRRNAARYLWPLRRRPLVYLEVGVHEGRSACWMLEHILLHPASRYIGIDCWGRSLAKQQAKARAQQNLQPYCRQVQLVEGHAQQVLAAGNWASAALDKDRFDPFGARSVGQKN
jgi:tRNA G46 methylase TrmB